MKEPATHKASKAVAKDDERPAPVSKSRPAAGGSAPATEPDRMGKGGRRDPQRAAAEPTGSFDPRARQAIKASAPKSVPPGAAARAAVQAAAHDDEPEVDSRWDSPGGLADPPSDLGEEGRSSFEWDSLDGAPADRPSDLSQEAFDTTWVASGDSDGERKPQVSQPGRKEAHADPLIGLIVADRYRIIAQIGRGAMGIVYRVEHTRIGKLLAMKLLAGELSTNKEVVRRFKQEALTVSRLSSPHTVQVFDYGVWQHLTFLVMELVEGPNLGRLLRRGGSMPFSRLGRLVTQVCASLAEAHAKGIVHRDIKPENIMILTDDEGQESAKVLDFGLAKLRESSELNEMTLQGAVVGTPYFISPEQVTGEPVDGRTDIYSLGAVMFRALTGTYPFQSATPMGMFTKHMTEEPPTACERAPELAIPAGVSAIVRRCMAKNPDERFGTVEALRDALLREIRALGLPSQIGLPTADEPPPSTKAGHGLRRRTRRGERLGSTQIATRDEVEAYQRKLRRATWVARVGLWTVALALVAGAVALARRLGREEFTGRERERNDTASHANPLPLGQTIEGTLGERIDPDTSDRDLYAFEVPAGSAGPMLALRVTALPNIPTTTLLYREGFEEPLARFRTGWPGIDLVVPALRVEPGRYFVAVVQDRETFDGSGLRFVYENVSDRYRLTVALAEPQPGEEIEPNDEPASGQMLTAPITVQGSLGWLEDTDVFCAVDGEAAAIRWRVQDGARPTGAVLEATPLLGAEAAPLVRVRPAAPLPGERARSAADVVSPWTSQPFEPAGGARCLRLRLVGDPAVDWIGPEPPRPDRTAYSVTLVR